MLKTKTGSTSGDGGAALRLIERIRDYRSVVVAFSGGVDSAVVLKAATEALGSDRVIAATAVSPSVAASDIADAQRVAGEIGVTHRLVETREFDNPSYVANPVNRCYFCKSELYERLREVRTAANFAQIANGTNADDLSDYRPGLVAAREFQVRSPLAEEGVGKAGVRALAATWQLSIHDKPASPCLSSRVPFGSPVWPELLRRIESAEALLRAMGVCDARVRAHGDVARLELPVEALRIVLDSAQRDEIDRKLRALGWKFVAVDLRPLQSGSMNRALLGAGFRAGVDGALAGTYG